MERNFDIRKARTIINWPAHICDQVSREPVLAIGLFVYHSAKHRPVIFQRFAGVNGLGGELPRHVVGRLMTEWFSSKPSIPPLLSISFFFFHFLEEEEERRRRPNVLLIGVHRHCFTRRPFLELIPPPFSEAICYRLKDEACYPRNFGRIRGYFSRP